MRFRAAAGAMVALALLAAGSGFVPLFDGKSFDGWEGDLKVFRLADQAIVAGSLEQPLPHNEFLCTKEEFGDFELRVKFKVLGKGANAGIQFRSKRVPNDFEVSGYQADLGDGWWGSLYDESRRNKLLVKADEAAVVKVLKRDDWNQYVIRCRGKRIELWINDLQTVDYQEPETGIAETGVIGLQIHGGGPSEAWYKDIELKRL
jgi:hypothetical protein